MVIAIDASSLPSFVVLSQLRKEDLIKGDSRIAKLVESLLQLGEEGKLDDLGEVRALLADEVKWEGTFSTKNGQLSSRGVAAHTPTKLFETRGIRIDYSYNTARGRALTESSFIATLRITVVYSLDRCFDYAVAELALQAQYERTFVGVDIGEVAYLLSKTDNSVSSVRVRRSNVDRDCVEMLRFVALAR